MTASPEERGRLARSQALAARLDQDPARFLGLTDDDKRLALQGARDLGGAALRSGRSGEGLRATLLEQLGIIPAGLSKERQELFGRQATVAGQAVGAQEALARGVGEQADRFLSGLGRTQDQFLAKLGALLAAGRLADARASLAGTTSAGREVQEQVRQRDQVQALGIPFSSQPDVDRVKAYLPQLKEYSAGQDELVRFTAARRKLRGQDFAAGVDRLGGVSFEPLTSGGERGLSVPAGERLTRSLIADHGLDAQTAAAVSGSAQAGFTARIGSRDLDEFSAEPAMSQRVRTALNDAVNEAVASVTGQQVGEKQRPLAELAGRLKGGLPGLNLQALTPAAVGNIDEAIEVFGKAGTSLDSLDQRFREAAGAVERATAAVRELERAASPAGVPDGAAGPVQRKALGGRVWSPHGTDSALVALTPGEFVVNRASSEANRGLLHEVNDAKGPLQRLAGGGLVRGRRPAFAELGGGAYGSGSFDPVAYTKTRQNGPVVGDFLTNQEAAHPVSKEATLGHNIRATLSAMGSRQRARQARADQDAAVAALDPLSDVGFDQQYLAAVKRADIRLARSGTRRPFLGLVQEELVGADARRQTASLLEQQLYASAVANPGDEATFGGAAIARGEQETSDYRRFRQGVIRKFARGGIVPGTGTTDSVAALLTPGEAVIPRDAVQQLGAGKGGGGFGVPPDAVRAMTSLGSAFGQFGGPAATLASAFGGFGSAVDRLGEVISRFPSELTITGEFTTNVSITGDSAFREMEPRFRQLVVEQVTAEIEKTFASRLPGLPSKGAGHRRLNG